MAQCILNQLRVLERCARLKQSGQVELDEPLAVGVELLQSRRFTPRLEHLGLEEELESRCFQPNRPSDVARHLGACRQYH